MRYCEVEKADFPDDQFVERDGIVLHEPPEGPSHPAKDKYGGVPLPPAAPMDPIQPEPWNFVPGTLPLPTSRDAIDKD